MRRERVQANCDYVGDGYGLPTSSMIEAVSLLARLEGILLDPVYSGKGMAGLIATAAPDLRDGDVIPLAAQNRAQRVRHGELVVGDQDSGFSHSY